MRVGDLAKTPAGETVLVVGDERDGQAFAGWVVVQWPNGSQFQIPRMNLDPLLE